MQDNHVPVGLLGWTGISVTGYITACDPGCNHTSSYHGSKTLPELKPGDELTAMIDDKWWHSSVGHKFAPLYLVEVRPDGALLRYGKQDIFVPSDGSKKLDEIPLDYAYGDLYVNVDKDPGADYMSSLYDIFTPEAYEAIVAAANKGDAEAINHLAYIRYYGVPRLGLDRNYAEAHRLWEKAAKMGHPKAIYCYATDFYYGDGVEEDQAKAFELFKKADQAGCEAVYLKLADIYLSGVEGVVEQDLDKALAYFTKAHELGYMNSGIYLGLMYYQGMGVEEDMEKAYKYFYPLTSCSGKWASGWADYYIGLFYEEGLAGLTPDDRTAFVYMEASAKLGNTMAMNKLAIMIGSGQGTAVDYDAAVNWWKKALEEGDADGAYYLAFYYAHDDGGNDPELAEKYQKIAAEMGHEMAQQEIEHGVLPGFLEDSDTDEPEDEPEDEPVEPEDEPEQVVPEGMEELHSDPESLNHYIQICSDCCSEAKRILQEQQDPSPITDMARKVIYYGAYLGQFEHTLSAAYSATKNMAECLFEHPRLLLELKQTEYEILRYIESVQGHEMGITSDLHDEIAALRANIQAADEGRFQDINDGRMLKSDPVEWTKKYEDVIDDADREAYSRLTDCPRGMGFCFAYWMEKRNALAKRGIEWRSPNVMNPGVMFD